MQIRTIAAALNGSLVLVLYLAAWGVPSFTIALLEVALAVAAALSTWYALLKVGGPLWMARLRLESPGVTCPSDRTGLSADGSLP